MGERAKSTRKAATSASYVDPPEFDEIAGSSDEGEDSDEEVEETKGRKRSGKGRGNKGSSSTAKKRKTDKGKGKGKKGAKANVDHLRTLPMDLLVEIFSYLLPFELLQLSRTRKEYRALLYSKRSKSIWRTARRLVELPDLEADDLSEMAFAQLIFGNTCDACDVKCTRPADFALRTRLCKDCRKDSFVKLNMRFSKDYPQYHPSTLDAVITTSYSPAQDRYSTSSSSYALKSDLDYYSKKLHELQEDDDGDAELFNRNSYKSASSNRSGRSSRRSMTNDPADESDEPESRDKQFIEERKEATEVVKEDAEMLTKKYKPASNIVKRNADGWSRIGRAPPPRLFRFPGSHRIARLTFSVSVWFKLLTHSEYVQQAAAFASESSGKVPSPTTAVSVSACSVQTLRRVAATALRRQISGSPRASRETFLTK